MSDVVFILGAGASKDCGAPLMADFIDVATHLFLTNSVVEYEEHFDLVFRAIGKLQGVHSKAQLDLTNIESIFTAFEIANIIKRLPGYKSSEIPGIVAALKKVIVTTLEEKILFPVNNSIIGVPQPYNKFATLIKRLKSEAKPRETVAVITFNYDIACDMGLFRNDLGPEYGIPSDVTRTSPVPLYKLHGSLNWGKKEDTQEVCVLPLGNFFAKMDSRITVSGGPTKIFIGSCLTETFMDVLGVKVNPEPVIVPPTWNKSDYHLTLSTVWSKAAYALGQARSIFIIGYSLPETDAFFRLLYALGTVGDSPLQRVVVYNPDKSGIVDQKFRQILGPGAAARYQYKTLTFAEAIKDIAGIYRLPN